FGNSLCRAAAVTTFGSFPHFTFDLDPQVFADAMSFGHRAGGLLSLFDASQNSFALLAFVERLDLILGAIDTLAQRLLLALGEAQAAHDQSPLVPGMDLPGVIFSAHPNGVFVADGDRFFFRGQFGIRSVLLRRENFLGPFSAS